MGVYFFLPDPIMYFCTYFSEEGKITHCGSMFSFLNKKTYDVSAIDLCRTTYEGVLISPYTDILPHLVGRNR